MNSYKYALVSVYDKSGIADFVKVLIKLKFTIIATAGTLDVLKQNGVKAVSIEEITGHSKEAFDGRIKTISFQIESGILFDRKNPVHVREAQLLNIPRIDMVVCNLYPFEKSPIVENIDVGGPTMIRAAAKNYDNVIVVVDPKDYKRVADSLEDSKVNVQFRKELAAKAFYHLSFYDSQIGNVFSDEKFPSELTIPLRKVNILRYGENPHQQGALYLMPKTNSPLSRLDKLWGRDLSGTNIGDIHAGLETVRQFKEAAATVIKHLSPCGIATGANAKEALDRAIKGDPVSAFGGVIVMNRPMDKAAAEVVAKFKNESEGNIDIVAVPKVTDEALALLKGIRKSMGIYTFGEIPPQRSEKLDLKYFSGGVLLQDFDNDVEECFASWRVVTEKKPSEKQLQLMQFGVRAVKAVRSNAVVVVDKDIPMTRGIGSGQTSRIGAVKIALEQSGNFVRSGMLISDSYFPFDDSVKLAAEFGIGAIAQQGGSIADVASINAANEAGIPMVFTGRRAFRH